MKDYDPFHEKWRKLYSRRHADLDRRPLAERGLFDELTRVAHDSGVAVELRDGEDLLDALAIAIRARPSECAAVKTALDSLLAGKLLAFDGRRLTIEHFDELHLRLSPGAIRKRRQRERRERERADGAAGEAVTRPSMGQSRRKRVTGDVTGDARSDPNRSDLDLETKGSEVARGAAAAAPVARPPAAAPAGDLFGERPTRLATRKAKAPTTPARFLVADVERALAAGGRYAIGAVDAGLAARLAGVLASLPDDVTLASFERLGRWYGAGGAAWVRDLDARHLATGSHLRAELVHAAAWDGSSPVSDVRGNGAASRPARNAVSTFTPRTRSTP